MSEAPKFKTGQKCTVKHHYGHTDESKVMTIGDIVANGQFNSGYMVRVSDINGYIDSGLIIPMTILSNRERFFANHEFKMKDGYDNDVYHRTSMYGDRESTGGIWSKRNHMSNQHMGIVDRVTKTHLHIFITLLEVHIRYSVKFADMIFLDTEVKP